MLGSFDHDGLHFDVADRGPADDPAGRRTVVCLHGFPQTGACWDGVAGLLADAGYRVLVPDQRGYSPGARPGRRGDYRIDRLTGDVVALLEAAGVAAAHVVGHDWGGAVAWHLAAAHPRRLHSLSVVSTPHPRAYGESLWRSPQLLRSWYMGAFQLPVLPELALTAAGGAGTRRALTASGLPDEAARDAAAHLQEPGAARGALNWYRAAGPGLARTGPVVGVPTLYVWSSGDPALDRVGAERTARHVLAPYRFEVLEDVPHWVPDVAPDRLAGLLASHLETATPP